MLRVKSSTTDVAKRSCHAHGQKKSDICAAARTTSVRLHLSSWQIGLDPEMVKFGSRVLPVPLLRYDSSFGPKTEKPNKGQWNMDNKKLVDGAALHFWAAVNFSSWCRKETLDFFEAVASTCERMGMDWYPIPLVDIWTPVLEEVDTALNVISTACAKELQELGQMQKKPQLLFVILPDGDSEFYGTVKRICETELGIVSQCIQPEKTKCAQKYYLDNLALKINVKVGGRNNVLNDAIKRRIHLVTDIPTIIIGGDVSHPQPGDVSSPSISGVVASMDWPEITKYRASISAQPHREEKLQNLYSSSHNSSKGVVHGGMIREHLTAFRSSTGRKPERIIFYRDGVSESQFSQVLQYEMEAIRKACASLEEGYLPPVTFVVVQKGHHTRLFTAEGSTLLDESDNAPPGTVVDTRICHPSGFDFYLTSHAGIQGTTRPAHYHVLFDENGFTADALQTLTYNLCYTYARCTSSVSIVPPVYYAHLAASRARHYKQSGTSSDDMDLRVLDIKDEIKDVMYYC